MDQNGKSHGKNSQNKKAGLSCDEARRLLDLYGESVQEVMVLHEQQFHCVVEGDITANRFDVLIHGANQRKQNAKYAYMLHLQEHGCSSLQDEFNVDRAGTNHRHDAAG